MQEFKKNVCITSLDHHKPIIRFFCMQLYLKWYSNGDRNSLTRVCLRCDARDTTRRRDGLFVKKFKPCLAELTDFVDALT